MSEEPIDSARAGDAEFWRTVHDATNRLCNQQSAHIVRLDAELAQRARDLAAGEVVSAPVRIQRKRAKGFDLQAESRAINGLDCVYVGRPSAWGNRFHIGLPANQTEEDCVRRFLCEQAPEYDDYQLKFLRGKNLACWCEPGAPCHADVLLEMANRP